jgi:hypothetical protein
MTQIWITSWLKILRYFVKNNSIQFFIIYVPSQQPNGQLQTQHNLNAGIYIIEK